MDGTGDARGRHRVGAEGPPGGLGPVPSLRPLTVVAQSDGPVLGKGQITLGPAAFDARTGALSIGGIDVRGLRLDVWRAPTDNDNGAAWQPDLRDGPLWVELGLHRMQHRLDSVELGDDALTVRTRVAPAAREVALRTVYRWTSDERGCG